MTIGSSHVSEGLLLLLEQGMDSNLAPGCSSVERQEHLPSSLFTGWGPGAIRFSLESKNWLHLDTLLAPCHREIPTHELQSNREEKM